MTLRGVVLGLVVLGVALGVASPTHAANSVSGSAFGASANLLVGTVAETPKVVLPPDGGSTEAHEATLAAPLIITSGTLTANSTGTIGPLSATATSKAAVEQVAVLPANLVTADAVLTSASCTGDGTTATCSAVGTTILGLAVNGIVLGNITPAPNTTITIPLVGTVKLNEQITGGNGVTTASLTVNLIHVQLSGLLGSGDIIVGQAQAGVDFTPQAVDPCDCPPPQNSVSGEAFGSEIDLGSLVVEKNPAATLSSQGGSATAGVPSVLVPSTLSSGIESQTTSGSLTPTAASSQSMSSVAGANVLLGLVTADLLKAMCSCTGNGATASCNATGTIFTNLVVDGVTITLPVAPNTTIPILGLGSVILNEQAASGNGTTTSALTVNMVHVIVNGIGDVVVSSAHCDVDLTLVDPSCNPCDDGDPCNGSEVCDPLQGCLPGPPPPTLCTTTSTSTTSTSTSTTNSASSSTTSSTSSSTIPAPVCGNGVIEAGEQCDPPGSISCPAGSPAGAFLACGASCTCPAAPTTTSTTSPAPTTTTTSTVTTSTITTTTTTTTLPPQCGNGTVDGSEQCDPAGGLPCATPPGFPPLVCAPDCTCPDPCPEFAFLLKSGGKFGNAVQVTGGIGANDPGARFGLGKDAFVSDGSTVAADNLRLGQRASVFHVEANGLQMQPSVVIRGGRDFATLPLTTPFCLIPTFTCSGQPVIVPPGGSVGPLPPGSYGPLTVYPGGVLVLQPGTFDFCSFRAGKNAAITPIGATQTTIRVTGDFRLGNGGVLAPAAGTPIPQIDVAGRNFRVSAQATLEAFSAAPNALLRVGRGGQIRGTACARLAKSDKRVVLSCPP